MINYIKVFAIIGMGLFIFGFGVHVGKGVVQAKWDKEKLIQANAVSKAESDVIVKQQKQSETTSGVANAAEKNINSINAEYNADVGKLQSQPSPPANSSPASGVSVPASGNNAAPRCDRLSSKSKLKLLGLMRAADIQTQQLISCQNWITEQQQIFNGAK